MCVAQPIPYAPAAVMIEPVKPVNKPIAPRSAKKRVAPTSGYKPILISGIAKRECGVTKRNGAAINRPKPPPMT